MRIHRITHPIIGPASWREMVAAAKIIRATGRRICTWCHEDIKKPARTRCGRQECAAMLWQAQSWKRCAVLVGRAAKHTCSKCGHVGYTECDHITPVSLGGLGDLENLRLLCGPCHKTATKRLRSEKSAYVAAVTDCGMIVSSA